MQEHTLHSVPNRRTTASIIALASMLSPSSCRRRPVLPYHQYCQLQMQKYLHLLESEIKQDALCSEKYPYDLLCRLHHAHRGTHFRLRPQLCTTQEHKSVRWGVLSGTNRVPLMSTQTLTRTMASAPQRSSNIVFLSLDVTIDNKQTMESREQYRLRSPHTTALSLAARVRLSPSFLE